MYKSRQRVWVNGEELELITISELAKAIRRSVETVRAWERKGIIPKALFRGPNGLRLYHPDEVAVMRKILKRVGGYAKQDELKSEMWQKLIAARKGFLGVKDEE